MALWSDDIVCSESPALRTTGNCPSSNRKILHRRRCLIAPDRCRAIHTIATDLAKLRSRAPFSCVTRRDVSLPSSRPRDQERLVASLPACLRPKNVRTGAKAGFSTGASADHSSMRGICCEVLPDDEASCVRSDRLHQHRTTAPAPRSASLR